MQHRILRSCRGRHDSIEPREIHFVGRGVAESLMNAPTVVKVEVLGQSSSQLRSGLVGAQINIFVLDAAPQALDKHVPKSSQLHPS